MKSLRIKILAALLLASPATRAVTYETWSHNREGLRHFGAKKYYPAYQEFLRALENDPLNPELHLNLARTFEANEEWDKAERAYSGALALLPEGSTRRFEALFNLGGVMGKQGKIDEALRHYQAALDMDPDSIEVKTNIELLWQSGQGGGKGKQDPKQQDQKQNPDQQNQDGDPKQDEPKPQPKPFDSQQLSPEDVKRILDEIKNQEQNIRAQDYEKGAKESPKGGKDW